MNIHNQTIEIIELKETELKSQQLLLMKKAKKASKNAYAPYSEYKVGAAVLLQNNKIITGNNQENAAYPSGLCAERIAVFASKSLYPNTEILKIAIHIDNKKPIQKAVMPCGSCRQSISEYETIQSENIEILTQKNNENIFISKSIKNLLPISFNSIDIIG